MKRKFFLPFAIIVVLICMAWFVYGRDQKTKLIAQGWEYKGIIISRDATTAANWSNWFETSLNGATKLPLPVDVPKRLNELGAEGWELVSVIPISNNFSGGGDYAGYTGQVNYFLKRPK